MIKAICYDLDGVYFTPESFQSFKREIAKLTRKDVSMDEIFHGDMMNSFKSNEITENEYWDYVRNELGLDLSSDEFKDILKSNYEVNEEVKNFVRKSKKAGYKTCICSNNFPTRIKALDEKFDFLSDFDAVVLSFQVGALKPDKKIFQTLIEKSGVEPEEIVYSDDKEVKLSGANELGINTFVYESFEQFISELEKLGFRI